MHKIPNKTIPKKQKYLKKSKTKQKIQKKTQKIPKNKQQEIQNKYKKIPKKENNTKKNMEYRDLTGQEKIKLFENIDFIKLLPAT